MFITFEGPDGSGKTTQSKLLAEYLTKQGKAVLWTREPGGTDLGKTIRNILLDNREVHPAKLTELLLFCADRAQHVSEVIKPALAQGKIVICDRYIDSTTAYQCGGRGFEQEMVERLNSYSTENLIPNVTILIDIPSDIGLKRASKKGVDKFESEKIEFHNSVREKYLEIAKSNPRIRVFSGLEPINTISTKVIEIFNSL